MLPLDVCVPDPFWRIQWATPLIHRPLSIIPTHIHRSSVSLPVSAAVHHHPQVPLSAISASVGFYQIAHYPMSWHLHICLGGSSLIPLNPSSETTACPFF